MRLFLRIFRNYALVAAAIFLLQWFPVPVLGVFVMFAFGIFWIGVVVHVFMMVITVQSIIGALPRLFLILPGTFYATGLAVGLYSDIPVLRWQSQQQWFQIDKQIPMDTHDLAIPTTGTMPFRFRVPGGALQPEKFGFGFSDRGSGLHPSPYAVVIGGGSCADSSVGLQFSSATIASKLPAHQPLRRPAMMKRTVGTLSGAHLFERVPIFCFPSAGCGLVDNPSSWVCTWFVSPLWRYLYVGYFHQRKRNWGAPHIHSDVPRLWSAPREVGAAVGTASTPRRTAAFKRRA